MDSEINKFYPKWRKYKDNGEKNPNYLMPVADWEKWETPPTNKDATTYIVPKANNSSATEFSPERQNSNEYIVPTYSNEIELAPDRGLPFDLLAEDLKDLKEHNAKKNKKN
jgi:hypothetical protein